MHNIPTGGPCNVMLHHKLNRMEYKLMDTDGNFGVIILAIYVLYSLILISNFKVQSGVLRGQFCSWPSGRGYENSIN